MNIHGYKLKLKKMIDKKKNYKRRGWDSGNLHKAISNCSSKIRNLKKLRR